MRIKVRLQRLPGCDDLPLPTYETAGAAGLDLRAAVQSDLTLLPGQFASVPCGLRVALPDGYEGQVRPRSGLALAHGLSILNSPGTIDSDYRGEIEALLVNFGPRPFVIARGARIAQLVIAPVAEAELVEVVKLPGSRRGRKGFGHTGL